MQKLVYKNCNMWACWLSPQWTDMGIPRSEPGEPYRIKQEHCLHCGNCYEVCPVRAVGKRK